MGISKRKLQTILYLSAAALILPLLAFPTQFGTELVRTSWTGIAIELVFYGIAAYFFHRQTSLLRLVAASGVCLIYRFTLGTLFGISIGALYSMNMGVAWTLGVSSYLPAILFQVVTAPFILKPILVEICRDEPESSKRESTPLREPKRSEVRKSSSRPVRPIVVGEAQLPPSNLPAPVDVAPERLQDLNGFERAVRYIGEHSAVHMAAVVDDEGLTLSNFTRGDIDIDAWAPLALLFVHGSEAVLQRTQLDDLERVDIQLRDNRVIVAQVGEYYLMVVSDRHDDDLLSIRLNQAMDMISKYVAERYGDKMNINTESIHV